MSTPNEKIIGQQILADIDYLIELVVAAELKSPQEAEQVFDEGCRIIADLFNLLEKIIGPQKEYLETAVKELVAQRMPDQRLINGFSDFNPLLDRMCKRVVANNLAAHSKMRHSDIVAAASRDKVERALNLLFPHEKILKQHRYNGIYFDYYLPSLKIAVEEGGSGRGAQILKEFLCRRDSIRVVSVDKSMNGYREIARQIKRQLAALNRHQQ